LKKQVSREDGTIKYLWQLPDGNAVETVVMQYKHGNTVCISSQVGCRQGCAFCASTIGGLIRNLEPSEMLNEVLYSQMESGVPITGIVLMGIGEPLDNFDNVMRFLKLVNHPKGMNIGMRHISLSTSGIVPRIYDLLDLNLQLTLSVSLHAPNNEIRSQIMPVNKSWDVDELLNACKIYAEKTSRRISFEYALIKGVNDTTECANELSKKLKGILCHVNLIPANEVPEKGHKRSDDSNINNFKNILEKNGLTVTIRRTLGSDINASCGQLRREKILETR
jgi:23S rRNA (adenine2503-C2)-methyltransferase